MIRYIFILFCLSIVGQAKKKYKKTDHEHHHVNNDTQKEYKISMVSSERHPSQPALFTHAESPVWDAKNQALLFVDVHQQNVHRLDYVSGKIETKYIGYGQVNVVALVANSNRLLVAVRSALYLLDFEVPGDAALRLLASVDEGLPDNVINEGKPDSEGRFWAGTKGPHIDEYVYPDKASLYSFGQDFLMRPQVHLRPVTISNGLIWSLNDTVLYYIDSGTRKIEAFDFDQRKGEINRRRTIIDICEHGYNEEVIPDGMTIDDRGDLWVALMFGGTILHINPDARKVIYTYKLPVSRVTSLQWGGPSLDELFVTTSKGRSESSEPFAGALFTVRGTGRRGVLPNYFRFDDVNEY